MLDLRPAIVVERDRAGGGRELRLLVQLTGPGSGGGLQEALADGDLVGGAEPGDRVILRPGDGGPASVHVNLTRGLAYGADAGDGLKLAGTTLEHKVDPVDGEEIEVPLGGAAAVLASHAQLAPLAWAFAQAAPGASLGYVQVAAGRLAGALLPGVADLRSRGLLAGHITAGAAFGGADGEALTTAGAVGYALSRLGWDAVVCGPGPSPATGADARRQGHVGAMHALDSAHAALALGCHTLLVAEISSSDRPSAPRGIAPWTLALLDLLLEPVTVALPAGIRSPVGSDLRASLRPVFAGGDGRLHGDASGSRRPARIARHDWRRGEVDLPAFARDGLLEGTAVAADPVGVAAALAGGSALAHLLAGGDRRAEELESA